MSYRRFGECQVSGCHNPKHAWGRYCQNHRKRLASYGHPKGRRVDTPTSGTNVGLDGVVEMNIPGMGRYKTSVANALNMGLITRDAAGGFRGLGAEERNDVAAEQQREQQQTRQDATTELEALRASGDAPDVDTSRLIDAVSQAVPGPAIQRLAHDFVVNGTMDAASVAQISEAAGWSAEHGQQIAQRVHDGLRRQAVTAVTSQGVPAAQVEEAFAWMEEHDPLGHQHAILGLIHGSDTSEFKRLGRKFYLAKVIR